MKPFKQIIGENRRYTQESREDLAKLRHAISKLFNEMVELGYDPVHVAYQITSESTSCVAYYNITTSMEARKKELGG